MDIILVRRSMLIPFLLVTFSCSIDVLPTSRPLSCQRLGEMMLKNGEALTSLSVIGELLSNLREAASGETGVVMDPFSGMLILWPF